MPSWADLIWRSDGKKCTCTAKCNQQYQDSIKSQEISLVWRPTYYSVLVVKLTKSAKNSRRIWGRVVPTKWYAQAIRTYCLHDEISKRPIVVIFQSASWHKNSYQPCKNPHPKDPKLKTWLLTLHSSQSSIPNPIPQLAPHHSLTSKQRQRIKPKLYTQPRTH
jgi:hypothetical protein